MGFPCKHRHKGSSQKNSNVIICLSYSDCQGALGYIMFEFREVARRWPALIGSKSGVNRIEIEPQNTEQGIMNVEVLKPIKIHNS